MVVQLRVPYDGTGQTFRKFIFEKRRTLLRAKVAVNQPVPSGYGMLRTFPGAFVSIMVVTYLEISSESVRS